LAKYLSKFAGLVFILSFSCPLLRLRTSSTLSVAVNPSHLLSDPSIYPWSIALSTAITPGHHAYQGVVAVVLQGDQGSSRVPLAGVLARVGGTYHVGGDIGAGVGCGGVGACSIPLGVNINFIEHTRLRPSRAECSPSSHCGGNIVIVLACVRHAGRHYSVGEGHILVEADDRKVLVL